MKTHLNYLITLLTCCSITGILAQELRLSFSSGLPIAGEHNATYDGVHSLGFNYRRPMNELWVMLLDAAYTHAPYNSNFRLAGGQLLSGVRYLPRAKKMAFYFLLGIEYSKENYAFKFMQHEVHGSFEYSNLLLKGGTDFPLFKDPRIHPFVEIIPGKRTMIGFSLSHSLPKKQSNE